MNNQLHISCCADEENSTFNVQNISLEEYRIEISLKKNFQYSNTISSGSSTDSLFLGRKNESARLVDHLFKGFNSGGSFLISGYRGAGKTRFVTEALDYYKKETNKNKRTVVPVWINLGSDNNLNSRTVLFNMISLLKDCIEEETDKKIFPKIWFKSVSHFLPSLILSTFIIFTVFLTIFFYTNNQSILFYDEILKTKSTILANFLLGTIVSFLVMFILGVQKILFFFAMPNKYKLINKLEKLLNKIHSHSETYQQYSPTFFKLGEKFTAPPLNNNQIESNLLKILEELKKQNFDVIFIFDELDKLTGGIESKADKNIDLTRESKIRKQQVDTILGDLKNLITSSKARYIFIAGRDMYDAYLSERGSANSLYESLFSDHIYIPSLLTDRSDRQTYLLDSMIETFVISNLFDKPEDIADLNEVKLEHYIKHLKAEKLSHELLMERNYILKILIHFLALHSWGNYKRLITLFESFVISPGMNETHYKLIFTTKDIQRLILSSNLYIMFHHNLSRMLMNADDKLVVSSFSLYHHIMKYHGIGFSRENILRMYETINIHSSPELTRIVDIILNNVLRNHLRRVRNGLYRHRFSFLHEKEIHFITNINDDESAAFNFSLNAMDAVKQHYRSLITNSQYANADERYGDVALASIHVIVANFHFWEQAFDEATIHYGIAADILERNVENKPEPEKISLIIQLIEVYLKQGSVAERVGNFARAASLYISAEIKAEEYLKVIFNTGVKEHDSKWDILRQPKWAKHFLNLKRSALHYLTDATRTVTSPGATDVTKYREGILSLFIEDPKVAYLRFIDVARSLDQSNERSYFLLGNAYLKAGFSILLSYSNKLYIDIHKERNSCKEGKFSDTALRNSINVLLNSLEHSFKQLEKFSLATEVELVEFEKIIKREYEYCESDENENIGLMYRAFGLMKLSASHFSKGQLNLKAATSSLSIVMMWEALLAIFPWHRIKDLIEKEVLDSPETKKQIKKLQNYIEKIRLKRINESKSFIFRAQERALKDIGYNTGTAFSHFMKTTLTRNLDINLEDTLFEQERFLREMFLDKRFLKYHMHQHYSVFGQVVVTSIYWEETTAKIAQNRREKIGSLAEGDNLLPYSIRYYSTMLWLKGREHLDYALDSKFNKCVINKKISYGSLEFDLIKNSVEAIINLFRASQYVIKTHGETSSMSLPPLFIIYFNMWEIIFRLVSLYIKNYEHEENYEHDYKSCSFEDAVFNVRKILDESIKKAKDISSRVLDLPHVEQLAVEQLKIIERMKDQNSRERTSIMRNKYYLEDDYEDNMFNLDWFYCRFLAPGALIYRMIIKNEMDKLRKHESKKIPFLTHCTDQVM